MEAARLAAGPAPAASALREERVRAADGTRIRVSHARPGGGAARATVVFLPGRAEFVEKHAETVAELLARGYAVASLDWRGQGLSDRLLKDPARAAGHVGDVGDYLRDLDAALARVDALDLPRPRIMLAHSMGGHIGLRHLHDRPGTFAAAVMTAPMWGIRLGAMPEPLARLLASTAVALGLGERFAPGQSGWDPACYVFEGNLLTSCPDRFATFRQLLVDRPDLALGGVTWGWLAAALRSIALARSPGYPEAVRTPILVCQSANERIVSNQAQDELIRRLPDARLLVMEAARHEVLLELPPVRERFFAAFEEFVAGHVGAEAP